MLRAHRTSFLGRFSAGIVVALVPIAAACNGHVSLGNSGTGVALQPITASKASASATATSASGAVTCAAGWAHPNICCTTGSNTECGTWDDNPFRACESGYTTYPDQFECCDLENPSTCVDQSPTGVTPPPSPPPVYACGFACPPGWSSVTNLINPGYGEEGPACCQTDSATGVTECVPQGESVEPVSVGCAVPVSSGSSGTNVPVNTTDGGIAYPIDAATPPPPEDAGSPVPTQDAGTLPGGWIDDAGCSSGDDAGSLAGWDGGTAGLCSPCPSGWSASDPAQPELCCTTLPGITLCFSQATGSATSVGSYEDGGASTVSVPPSGGSTTGSSGSPTTGWGTSSASTADGAPSPSCTGSATSCSCEETINGSLYALDCYTGSGSSATCSCSINGSTVGSSFSVASCNDPDEVTSAFSSSTGCDFTL